MCSNSKQINNLRAKFVRFSAELSCSYTKTQTHTDIDKGKGVYT